LDLHALARSGDVGDGSPDLGEVLQLLFVRKIQRLTGIFNLVERRIGLGLKNGTDSLR
jgi:hypothetical protein